jgi:hypothetical protein
MSTTRVLRRSGQFSLNASPSTSMRASHRVDALADHQPEHLVGDIATHAVVGAAPGQDHLGVVADLLRLVGQVVRIHADAVAADQAGAERQEVPLGAGRFQHLQGVDAELVEDHGQVVDQRDVEVALGVLDDLGGFGHLDAGRLVGAGGDDAGVERVDKSAAPASSRR